MSPALVVMFADGDGHGDDMVIGVVLVTLCMFLLALCDTASYVVLPAALCVS